MQEKEALKLERARQRRLERQRQEEQEDTMLNDAISHLTTNGENHVNHYDPPETQTGKANTSVLYKIGPGGWGERKKKKEVKVVTFPTLLAMICTCSFKLVVELFIQK